MKTKRITNLDSLSLDLTTEPMLICRVDNGNIDMISATPHIDDNGNEVKLYICFDLNAGNNLEEFDFDDATCAEDLINLELDFIEMHTYK